MKPTMKDSVHTFLIKYGPDQGDCEIFQVSYSEQYCIAQQMDGVGLARRALSERLLKHPASDRRFEVWELPEHGKKYRIVSHPELVSE